MARKSKTAKTVKMAKTPEAEVKDDVTTNVDVIIDEVSSLNDESDTASDSKVAADVQEIDLEPQIQNDLQANAEEAVADTEKTVEVSEAATADVEEPVEGTLKSDDVVEVENTPEPLPQAADDTAKIETPVVAPQVKKVGFVPLVLGGGLAAVLGFVAARGEFLDDFLPPDWRMNADHSAVIEKVEGLASTQSDIHSQLGAMNEKITTLSEQPAEAPLNTDELLSSISQLNERIAVLENRPVVVTKDTSHDYSADFAALNEVTAKQQAEMEALLNEARIVKQASFDAAQGTLARAAAARIAAAVESGAVFGDALSDLETTQVGEIPSVLRDVASDGVITLAALQQTIASAARAALAASPVPEDAGLGGFLKRQLGARSVKPRSGDDPDAVLSRMEAAVRNGDLSTALTELENLPQEARAAMSDWLENAKIRLAVTTASQGLVQRLAAN